MVRNVLRIGSSAEQKVFLDSIQKNLNRDSIISESSSPKINYAFNCFQYIHSNPVRAGLVDKMEKWEFYSFIDYINQRNGALVNKKLAQEIINFDKEDFDNQSYLAISLQNISDL